MSTEERVAASFTSRYFELLMTDAKQLASFYLPKAQFNHEGKTTSVVGSDNVGRALARLYPNPNHGRVVIKDVQVKPTEAGRFAISVGGTYFRRGLVNNADGEEFRHVIELHEHQGSNGVYGIVADTRTVQRPQHSTWAMETPPMFAKAGNESAIPELVQPPASEPIVVPVAAPPKEATPKPSPKVSPALPPQAPPVEVEEVAVEVAEEKPKAPEATPEAAPVAENPKSFLDMVRARASKPVTSVPVARVEAKTEEMKVKEEADRVAKEEAAKKEAAAAAERKAGKPKAAKKDDEDKEKKAAAAPEKRRAEANPKVMNHAVIFYDVIVKGLPKGASEKSVQEMISSMAPVKKINVKSQADKKDPTITRTFAFILFDHEAIVASGATVSATIQRVTKEGTQKFTNQRIQFDAVREKFTQEDPREKVEA